MVEQTRRGKMFIHEMSAEFEEYVKEHPEARPACMICGKHPPMWVKGDDVTGGLPRRIVFLCEEHHRGEHEDVRRFDEMVADMPDVVGGNDRDSNLAFLKNIQLQLLVPIGSYLDCLSMQIRARKMLTWFEGIMALRRSVKSGNSPTDAVHSMFLTIWCSDKMTRWDSMNMLHEFGSEALKHFFVSRNNAVAFYA